MARGELRIYLGAAPGVGKTYAMLNEGRRRQLRGTDVVIAYVETHGRPETTAQLADLEIIPRMEVVHRGQVFEELDLAAILERRPDVALVDELAHTNVPGVQHEKRWQDVEELLAAGISVITTVNIQHLESLNDVVAQITGITQRETVPDVFVRSAGQVELVDMTPEALRRRLAHGNVYKAETVDAALANYFRVGNLGALRELALLWVAGQVDDGLESYRKRHGITTGWETRERVVVALTGAPNGDRLIRRGARLAARGRAELVGVHIRPDDGLATADPALLADYRDLLEELGGRYIEGTGADVAETLVELARSENATQIVVGASQRSRWTELTRGSVINRLVTLAGTIDVHVISQQSESIVVPATQRTTHGVRERLLPRREASTPLVHRRSRRSRQTAWIMALVVIPLFAFATSPIEGSIGPTGLLLLLLLGPIIVAIIGGRAPALTAAVVGFAVADYLYIVPQRSFRIAGPGDFVTLVVFIVVASTVSVLVDRLARRTAEVSFERSTAAALVELAQRTAILDDGALDRLVDELRRTLTLDAVGVLTWDGADWRLESGSGSPLPANPSEGSYSAELSDDATLVVVGPALNTRDRRLLSAFVGHLRLARTTLALQSEATRAESLSDANDLRGAIIGAVSHDLRAPLANIKAAATSLTSTDVDWDDAAVRAFATTIDEEADRLTTLVVNLLDLSRLQAGMVGTDRDGVAPAEVVYLALASMAGDVTDVEVAVNDQLPLISTDAALFERVLANLIRNALDWSPRSTKVRVHADVVGDAVDFRVVDQGPGIAEADRERVFEPFQRLGDGGRAAVQGIGLGLAVTRGLCDALGVGVVIDDTPGGGTTVTLTVPIWQEES